MHAGLLKFPLLARQGQGPHFVLPWHLVFKFSQPCLHGYKSPLMCCSSAKKRYQRVLSRCVIKVD